MKLLQIILRPTLIYMLLFNGWLVFLDIMAKGTLGKGLYIFLGILGVLLILLSLLYSLRKRFLLPWGRLKLWLNTHIWLATAGAFLTLYHSELEFNGLAASLTFALMEVVVLTGAMTQFALVETAAEITRGPSGAGAKKIPWDDRVAWEALGVEKMRHWRAVHYYAAAILVIFAVLHILAELYYRGLYL